MQFSEQEMEDWVEEHVDQLEPFRSWDGPVAVERQLYLPSGQRLDLLVATRRDGRLFLTVLELKAVEVDAAALVQLLGYMRQVAEGASALPEDDVVVGGVLVGPSVRPEIVRALPLIPSVYCFHRVHATFAADGIADRSWGKYTENESIDCAGDMVPLVAELDGYIAANRYQEEQARKHSSDLPR